MKKFPFSPICRIRLSLCAAIIAMVALAARAAGLTRASIIVRQPATRVQIYELEELSDRIRVRRQIPRILPCRAW